MRAREKVEIQIGICPECKRKMVKLSDKFWCDSCHIGVEYAETKT